MRPRRGSTAGFAIIPILMLACSGSEFGQELTSPGVSIELAEVREETLSEVTYHFELAIPEAVSDPIQGRLELAFEWRDPLGRSVVLDFKDPATRAREISVNGTQAPLLAVNDHIVIPANLLGTGRNTVTLDFRAGDEALNRNEGFLYTLFVPDRARFSLPVFDQPGLKAKYRLTLDVPEAWTAVSNAPLESEPDSETLRFGETLPLPTYLFAFAAGEFEVETAEREGRTLRMFHRETDVEKVARNQEAVFDLHFEALEWLEEYTALPYPFQKLDFVLIPPFQYGGMEHAGAIFYRARTLFLDESATQNDYLRRAGLIAHEVAHMWFGDLVTMRWFDDVWLKEVFAGFFAAKIINPSFPEVNHDLRFVLSHQPRAYEVDRTAGANPIHQPLGNLNEAGSLYGAIIYQKAPVMMRQLELLVGADEFREGMREYLQTFGFANASWTDLIEILDRRTPEDLVAWSRVWVDQPGRPTLTAALSTDEQGVIVIEQSDPLGKGRLWPQALEVVAGRGDSVTRYPARIAAELVEVDAGFSDDLPDFILPDGSGLGYGLFRLDDRSLEHLQQNLPELPDPLLRGVGWITLWDAVLDRTLEPGVFLQLCLTGLASEDVEQNVQRILGYLATTYWRLLTPEQRDGIATLVEDTLWEGLANAEAATLKGALFRAYRDLALTPTAVANLYRIWSDELTIPGLKLSDRDRTDLAFELAVREIDGWAEMLEAQAESLENPDRRRRFDFIHPALSADESTRDEFFESLRDEANREHEPWVATAVAYLHHPLRATPATRYVTPSLELLEEIQRTGDIFFPKAWLDATLGGHNSPTAASAVREFLETRPEYPHRLRGKILQSADMLFRAERIVHGTTTGP